MMVQNLVLDQLIMHWSIQTCLTHLIIHLHTSSLGHINQVPALQISCKHYWQFPCGQSLWSHFFKNHTSLIFFQCLKNSLFPRKNLGVYCDSSFKPFCRKCSVLFLTRFNYFFVGSWSGFMFTQCTQVVCHRNTNTERTWRWCWVMCMSLTLYNPTSVGKFSILFSIYFLRHWQGEFVQPSWASLVGDHSLYSYDLSVWFRGDIVRRS